MEDLDYDWLDYRDFEERLYWEYDDSGPEPFEWYDV